MAELETGTTKNHLSDDNQKSLLLVAIGGIIAVLLVALLLWNLVTPSSEQSQAGLQENQQVGQLPPGEGLAGKEKVLPEIKDPQVKEVIATVTRKKADDPLAVGNINAPVTMLQFADFSCPLCYQWEHETHPKLQKLIDEGTLRLEFHPFVIFQDKYNSMLGARAALAAGQQGKFWSFLKNSTEYALQLVAKGEDPHIVWSDDLAKEIAQKAGVTNMQKFAADYANPEVEKQIYEGMKPIMQANLVAGTPGFMINNRLVPGAYPADVFLATIEAAAKDARTPEAK